MTMTESEQKFARAALAVFQRFGVRKATMEEIAGEAGVSKPTLYATFRNKDAALGGAIRLAKGAALASLRKEWSGAPDLAQKVDLFFDRLVLAGFDMLHQSPDPEAFENALGEASQTAIRDMRTADIDAVAEILAHAEGHDLRATDTRAYAEFVVTSAMNAKRLAGSRTELEAYLAVLKTNVLKMYENNSA